MEKVFIFESMRFKFKYVSFDALLEDIDRVKAHYTSFGLCTQYDIMPASLEVVYEITKEGQTTPRVN